jgi:hypothetical protein
VRKTVDRVGPRSVGAVFFRRFSCWRHLTSPSA